MNHIICKLPAEIQVFQSLTKDYNITDKIPDNIKPGDRVYFFHYSDKIPAEIYESYKCIGFHETDLPFGRGGSPVQNLIALGYTHTVLTAFKITGELDAGDVYLKYPLSLQGTITEILQRSALLAYRMILKIDTGKITPVPQEGNPVYFKRRVPQQSVVHQDIRTLPQFYDHIRMLDGEGYPRAFMEKGFFRFEFSEAELLDDKLVAKVVITKP